MHPVSPGFLNLGIIDIWGWKNYLLGKGAHVYCRVFSLQQAPHSWWPKVFPDTAKSPPGTKEPSIENLCVGKSFNPARFGFLTYKQEKITGATLQGICTINCYNAFLIIADNFTVSPWQMRLHDNGCGDSDDGAARVDGAGCYCGNTHTHTHVFLSSGFPALWAPFTHQSCPCPPGRAAQQGGPEATRGRQFPAPGNGGFTETEGGWAEWCGKVFHSSLK